MNPSAELHPSRLPILLLNAALILPPVFLYTVKIAATAERPTTCHRISSVMNKRFSFHCLG